MAREVDQAKLPNYGGIFSWIAATLRAHIEAVMPDYDRHDPKTWPVITSKYLRSFIGHEYDGTRLLPPYVAYERGLVNKCVAHFPDQEIKIMRADGPEFRGLYFHHFPFVFNFKGQARNFEYMHADHYIKWVSGITGTVPTTRTRGKDAPAPSPPSAFTECLEMLKEAQSNADVNNSEKSKQELTKARKDLAKEKRRADTAEKERENLKDKLEQSKEDEARRVEAVRQSNQAVKEDLRAALAEEKRQHNYTKKGREADAKMLDTARTARDIASNRANAAAETAKQQAKLLDSKEKELKAAKDKMTSQAKDLDASKQEATTAQEQINTIRDELRRIRGTETRKRQANDDTPRTRWKRVKNEFDE